MDGEIVEPTVAAPPSRLRRKKMAAGLLERPEGLVISSEFVFKRNENDNNSLFLAAAEGALDIFTARCRPL